MVRWVQNLHEIRNELDVSRISLEFTVDNSAYLCVEIGEYKVLVPVANILGKSAAEVKGLVHETLADLVRRQDGKIFNVWLLRANRRKAGIIALLSKTLAIRADEAKNLVDNLPCRVFRSKDRKPAEKFAIRLRRIGADLRCSWE